MRESIGSTFLYNIIFLFIVIVMGLLTATLNYYKGYKVNSYILHSVSKFSGYNDSSRADINRILDNIGYSADRGTCPARENAVALTNNESYCLYYYPDERSSREKSLKRLTKDGKPIYYAYGVTTFISIELPIVGKFKIPVYSKGERIYRFSCFCQIGGDEGCKRINTSKDCRQGG